MHGGQRPSRPHKYAGCFDRAGNPDLPASDRPDEGKCLYHAQLYYTFKYLLRGSVSMSRMKTRAQTIPVTLFSPPTRR